METGYSPYIARVSAQVMPTAMVQAVQYRGRCDELPADIRAYLDIEKRYFTKGNDNYCVLRVTDRQADWKTYRVHVTDWIIKDIHGVFSRMVDAQFRATYVADPRREGMSQAPAAPDHWPRTGTQQASTQLADAQLADIGRAASNAQLAAVGTPSEIRHFEVRFQPGETVYVPEWRVENSRNVIIVREVKLSGYIYRRAPAESAPRLFYTISGDLKKEVAETQIFRDRRDAVAAKPVIGEKEWP